VDSKTPEQEKELRRMRDEMNKMGRLSKKARRGQSYFKLNFKPN